MTRTGPPIALGCTREKARLSLLLGNARGCAKRTRSGVEGTYRQVCAEFTPDDAVGAMSAAHLSPNHTELGPPLRPTLRRRRLVDVGDLLPEVEVRGILVLHILDFDESGVAVLISQSPACG